ncbi:cell wall-binding repeat-containing protein [Mobiluncus mulieris]|uniref:N-acetylmuramoyl-L-alanine amidase LytC n=1 Tax=Mobiluncus mulieris TaxID=2052 RepID=A0A8G2M6Y7_9ACTO|nr:cell wall-binding repeat-containing protein [Mobiluncus mulieris]EEJ53002.1 putative N-acetylmuramoyl-L-alanine amidase CwlB [Mobiluncus mulieris ATCC 35243]MCU9971823.1 cell wall-binding repeat-containing protein [Mobiluncus mulieris]MCU9997129.1 cell wall-binding repeat-containing protein [Mobiluncus mulieris]MCV0001987.1 cell wall-binding repeat-containing protein [Mobiluncus mulieris]NMW61309.1 cell wall-binding repeat-containing protein [Mobiluncus mulieris]
MGVKRWLVGLVAAGSMLGLAGVSAVPAVAGGLAHERLAGSSGVETSLAVAKHTWGTTWPVVYVASNRNPVDALPAATIGDGPVVLTDGKGLNLGGVKPGKIVLLGGVGAVPQAIEDQAKATGAEVVRLAGADRNATAVAIAKQWVKVNGTPKNVYVTKNTGSGSPDAVAASVLRDGPILTFTNDASAAALPGVVSELKAGKVTALGGGAVVPDTILNTAAGGKATARLAGANRYETAFTIAKYGKVQKSGSVVYLASGTGLKDAMVAGAAKDGVILLSPSNGEGVKAKADALGASKLMIIGGTGVMPDTTVQAATTGIIPKPKLKDMTLAEMRANYPLAGEPEHLPSDIASYSYCLDDGDEFRIFYDAIGMPMVFKAEPYTDMTPQRLLDMWPWMFKDLSDAQRWFTDSNYRNYGDMTDPTAIYGFGTFLAAKPKPNNVDADHFAFYLSQCRKGAEHPEWAKPFPYGKRFEEAGYSCAGDKTGLKCFYWNDGDSTENNPHWWTAIP